MKRFLGILLIGVMIVPCEDNKDNSIIQVLSEKENIAIMYI
ncbi:hypothetical protein [Anaerococcus urinomassiliensis]|nr:hypothetical protein [Anaerococcus urinomassiliensis]